MPRSHWGIVFAALGLILASPSKSKEAQGNQAATSEAAQQQLERIGSALEKLPKGDAPDPGCKAGEDNRHSDLCAQWKAADAAADSAFWAMATFWAGVVGISIGIGTPIAAGAAAVFAKDAADHTRIGNEIAAKQEKTLNEARLTVGFQIYLAEQTSQLDVAITNVGNVPFPSDGVGKRWKDGVDTLDHETRLLWQKILVQFILGWTTEYGDRITIRGTRRFDPIVFSESHIKVQPGPNYINLSRIQGYGEPDSEVRTPLHPKSDEKKRWWQ